MADTELVLSIAIVATNNRAVLRVCLASIFVAPPQAAFEVLLVDNDSTDGTEEMVRAEFPAVLVQRNERPLPLTANFNINLRKSRGRYILLLNDDTVVHPGALDALVDAAERHQRAGVIGCRLLNGDGSLQQSCYQFPSPATAMAQALQVGTLAPWSVHLSNFKHWPHDREREVPWVSSACMLVRREAYEAVGPVDEGFAIYSDETDWQFRMRQAGWLVYFTPQPVVTHLGGTTITKLSDGGFQVQHESLERYFRKHYGALGLAFLRCSLVLEALIKLTALTLAGDRVRKRLDPRGALAHLHRARIRRYLRV